jgi:hypothetical protein
VKRPAVVNLRNNILMTLVPDRRRDGEMSVRTAELERIEEDEDQARAAAAGTAGEGRRRWIAWEN